MSSPLHPDEVGHTADIKHHIDTGDATPVHQLHVPL